VFDFGIGDILADAWLVIGGFEGIVQVVLVVSVFGMVLRTLIGALGGVHRRRRAAEDET
jgi:hypothetical protein